MYIKRSTLFLVWIATRLIIFLKISTIVWTEADIEFYFTYAGKTLAGLVPYLDFGLEYPPGAVPFFILPRFFADNLIDYRQMFVLEMMLVDLAGLLLILRYGTRFGFSRDNLHLAGLYYTALPAVMGLFAYQRYDLVPAVLVLASIVLLSEGRRVLAWILLGFGFAVKLYPIILAPVFLITGRRQQSLRRDLSMGIPAAIGAVAAAWLPFMFKAGSKFWIFLSYHGQRGIQLESLYASVLLLAKYLGYPVKTVFAFGSWNVEAPVSFLLAKLSLGVMLLLMAAVLVHCWLVTGRDGWDTQDLPRLAVLMVLAFIIGGKVVSPQYLLWVLPLIIIALNQASPHRLRVWGLFALISFLSFLIFPTNYKSLIDLELWPSLLLLARNALLAGLFYVLFKTGNSSSDVRNTREKYPNNG